ncbi:MAG: type II toxin-antitoxin system VapB family antitoxin [Pseudomonadota bacterium]
MITNIDIDETIVAEAMLLSGARTKREVVDRALREMVARAKRPSVRELFGIGGVDPDYDPKAPWARGSEAGQNRVEPARVQEPPAAYKVLKQAQAAVKPGVRKTSTARQKKS